MPHQSSSARRDSIQLSSGITIECTIITPLSEVGSHIIHGAGEEEVRNLAICLHPWSWLGGRMNDPVLQLVTEPLFDAGYAVLRYNSRGVGKSTGRASFTGSSEADDLKDLVQWARSTMPKLRSLVLIGYSYGSLITSLHPVLSDLPTSHILLSYPLGPRSWLTAFHGSRYQSALQDLVRAPGAHILILYGDQDDFTSVSSYDSWTDALRAINGEGSQREAQLEIVKIEGASHFWREDHAVDRLLEAVQSWVQR